MLNDLSQDSAKLIQLVGKPRLTLHKDRNLGELIRHAYGLGVAVIGGITVSADGLPEWFSAVTLIGS